MELYYLERAFDKQLPVLGICRGTQLINVKLGGSLYQDIGGFYGEIPQVYSILPKKKVKIDAESRLGKILNAADLSVNALHNQAISDLADPLKVVAREYNGIVQAVEFPKHPFLIGVQWHPEYMPQIKRQRQIFKALVQTARSGMSENQQSEQN
ncbi:MAG: gamma-glutamyl-gamma-aminobutyrate hydrolase family protein [Balneolaceae bacterium]|nr:gamma-glutamyl-gamma-aminobutyrate hydrolase family protein [Balneolaceae bacterium]